jgi:hypothetical protein
MLTLDGNDWLKSFQGLDRSLEADRSWSDGKRLVQQFAKGETTLCLGHFASAVKRLRLTSDAGATMLGRAAEVGRNPFGRALQQDGDSRHVLGGCQHIFNALFFRQIGFSRALRIARTHPVVVGVVQCAPTR